MSLDGHGSWPRTQANDAYVSMRDVKALSCFPDLPAHVRNGLQPTITGNVQRSIVNNPQPQSTLTNGSPPMIDSMRPSAMVAACSAPYSPPIRQGLGARLSALPAVHELEQNNDCDTNDSFGGIRARADGNDCNLPTTQSMADIHALIATYCHVHGVPYLGTAVARP